MSEAAGHSDGSAARGEVRSVLAVLERNRRTFAWKTSGLDEAGLRATTSASAMTLGGLVKHAALVEADWLAFKLAGQGYGPPWDAVDFDAILIGDGALAHWRAGCHGRRPRAGRIAASVLVRAGIARLRTASCRWRAGQE